MPKKHVGGTLDLLPVGKEITLGSSVFGFGPTAVRVSVQGVGRTTRCLLLGPLVVGGT
jgi:hypothetical protein